MFVVSGILYCLSCCDAIPCHNTYTHVRVCVILSRLPLDGRAVPRLGSRTASVESAVVSSSPRRWSGRFSALFVPRQRCAGGQSRNDVRGLRHVAASVSTPRCRRPTLQVCIPPILLMLNLLRPSSFRSFFIPTDITIDLLDFLCFFLVFFPAYMHGQLFNPFW